MRFSVTFYVTVYSLIKQIASPLITQCLCQDTRVIARVNTRFMENLVKGCSCGWQKCKIDFVYSEVRTRAKRLVLIRVTALPHDSSAIVMEVPGSSNNPTLKTPPRDLFQLTVSLSALDFLGGRFWKFYVADHELIDALIERLIGQDSLNFFQKFLFLQRILLS